MPPRRTTTPPQTQQTGKPPKRPVVPSISSHFSPIEPGKFPARGESGKPRPRSLSLPPRPAPPSAAPRRPLPPSSSARARAAVEEIPAPRRVETAAEPAIPAVLIIDDDAAIRDLLRRVVTRKGWRAETANDGSEGIQMVGAAPAPGYAVILLDLMMPNINGFEVIEHFKTHNPAMLGRIVVVTASPKVDQARIYSELIGGLIEKPFDITQLVTYLQPLVERGGQ